MRRYTPFAIILVLVLAACQPGQVVPPGFSLSLSGGLSIESGNSAQTTVNLAREGGFSDPVSLSVEGLPAGVTASFSETPLAGSSSQLTLNVSPSVAVGAYAMTVRGEAGSLSDTASLSLTVTEPPVSVASVAIQGFGGSHQVRQGYGTITLEVLGEQLDGIALAKLGNLNGNVMTNNDLSATIEFIVPHGADLGFQALSLVASAGQVDVPNAAEFTAITVAAGTGSDANQGTPGQPLQDAQLRRFGRLGRRFDRPCRRPLRRRQRRNLPP